MPGIRVTDTHDVVNPQKYIGVLWWSRLGAGLALAFINFAIQWQASLLRYAPEALASVNITSQLTMALTFAVAGRLADEYQPRVLMVLSSLLAALAVVLYVVPFHSVHELAAYVALTFCVNGFAVVGNVSSRVILPAWLPPQDLPKVNARWSWITLLRGVLGYALGGITLALGTSWALGSGIVLFLLSGALLYRFPRVTTGRRGATRSRWRDGMRWTWHHPLLRWSMIFGGALNFGMGVYLGELVLFGRSTLHLSAVGLGSCFAVSTVGSLIGIKWGSYMIQHHFKTVLVAVPVVVGVTVVLSGAAPDWESFLLALTVVEWGSSQSVQFLSYIRQTTVDAHRRGAIFGILSSMNIILAPVGTLLSGLIAHRWGVAATVIVAGAVMIGVGLPATMLRRALHTNLVMR